MGLGRQYAFSLKVSKWNESWQARTASKAEIGSGDQYIQNYRLSSIHEKQCSHNRQDYTNALKSWCANESLCIVLKCNNENHPCKSLMRTCKAAVSCSPHIVNLEVQITALRVARNTSCWISRSVTNNTNQQKKSERYYENCVRNHISQSASSSNLSYTVTRYEP